MIFYFQFMIIFFLLLYGNGRAVACCACSRYGMGGLFFSLFFFSSHLSILFF